MTMRLKTFDAQRNARNASWMTETAQRPINHFVRAHIKRSEMT
jgi:hypothetical protein